MGTANQTVRPGAKVLGAQDVGRKQTRPTGSASVHLDALRGLAAFSVLLNHWRDAFFVDYAQLPHHNLLLQSAYLVGSLGRQWVIVFFVMSGYLVGGSVVRSVSANRWSWRAYLLARMTRLYIVLLPALVLGGAIDWVGMHLSGLAAVYAGRSGMHALAINVHSTLTLPVMLGNALFLQWTSLPARLGHGIPTFGSNGPLWSLSYEFWYYIAFPILLLAFSSKLSWRMRAVCLAALVAWGWLVGSSIALLGIPWLMGVVIGQLPAPPLAGKWPRRAAIASALVLLGGGLVLDKRLDSLTGDLLLGAAISILIWITIHCATAPVSHAYELAARRAARSSYTLYLVHLPLLIFLKAWWHLPRALPNLHSVLMPLAVMFIVLLYAQAVYQGFERNTDSLRQRLKPFVFGKARA